MSIRLYSSSESMMIMFSKQFIMSPGTSKDKRKSIPLSPKFLRLLSQHYRISLSFMALARVHKYSQYEVETVTKLDDIWSIQLIRIQATVPREERTRATARRDHIAMSFRSNDNVGGI